MDVSNFILFAYLATGGALGALCISSVLRARAVKRRLAEQPDA